MPNTWISSLSLSLIVSLFLSLLSLYLSLARYNNWSFSLSNCLSYLVLLSGIFSSFFLSLLQTISFSLSFSLSLHVSFYPIHNFSLSLFTLTKHLILSFFFYLSYKLFHFLFRSLSPCLLLSYYSSPILYLPLFSYLSDSFFLKFIHSFSFFPPTITQFCESSPSLMIDNRKTRGKKNSALHFPKWWYFPNIVLKKKQQFFTVNCFFVLLNSINLQKHSKVETKSIKIMK